MTDRPDDADDPELTRIENPADGVPPTTIEDAAATRVESGTSARRFRRGGLLPEQLLERYEYDHEIRGGAEADVVVARRRADGSMHVVKLYRGAISPPPEDLLDRLDAADERHVVRIEDRGLADGMWFEVLEYCELGSLADLIADEGPKLDEGLVLEITQEIASSLQHLHSAELAIVHRDVKPANVLVRTRDPLDLVLADFGLSSIIGDMTRLWASAQRTVAYAAPEAIHGRHSRKSDWWSLGMCVAEMLTGAHPLLGRLQGSRAPDGVISDWVDNRLVPVDDVADPRWRALCEGLLTHDVETRWGEAEVFAWLGGDDPPVRRGFAAGRKRRVAAEPVAFAAIDGRGTTDYTDPVLLAAALGQHWDQAVALMGDDAAARNGRRPLLRFLAGLDLEDEAEAVLRREEEAEARLVRIRLLLDPDAEPVFNGVDLAGDGLARLAADAAGGTSPENVERVAALRRHGVLRAHTGQLGREGWAALDTAWIENERWLVDQLEQHRDRFDGVEIDAPTGDFVSAIVLRELTNDGEVARERRRVEQQRDPDAREQRWYAEVVDAVDPDAPSPARSLFVGIVHDLAVRETEADREAARIREVERRAALRRAYKGSLDRSLILIGGLSVVTFAALTLVTGLVTMQVVPGQPSPGAIPVAAAGLAPTVAGAALAVLLVGAAFNYWVVRTGSTGGWWWNLTFAHVLTLLVATAALGAWWLVGADRRIAWPVDAAGWLLIGLVMAHTLALGVRTIPPDAAWRIPAALASVPAGAGVALLVGVVGVDASQARWHDALQQRSAELVDRIALRDCEPAPVESAGRPRAWVTAEAICRSRRVRVSYTDAAWHGAYEERMDAARADAPALWGSSCRNGTYDGRWERGELVCFSRFGVAHLLWTDETTRTIAHARRPGRLRSLYRWWAIGRSPSPKEEDG